MDLVEFWASFWAGFDEDPGKIEDVEGLIFRNKKGEWFTAIAPPNETRIILVRVYFNPFTGEELK